MSQFELDQYDNDSQASHNYIPKTQIKDVLRGLNVRALFECLAAGRTVLRS
jgi:hypothetical protein